MVETNVAESKFAAIGMAPDAIKNMVKNKKATASLLEVLELAEVTECPKEMGALFSALATKLKPNHQRFKQAFSKQIADKKWTKTDQLNEGLKFLDSKL